MIQLQKEMGLSHTAKQGGRFSSLSDCKHGEGEAMMDVFCTYYQHLHMDEKKALHSITLSLRDGCHFSIGLSLWDP